MLTMSLFAALSTGCHKPTEDVVTDLYATCFDEGVDCSGKTADLRLYVDGANVPSTLEDNRMFLRGSYDATTVDDVFNGGILEISFESPLSTDIDPAFAGEWGHRVDATNVTIAYVDTAGGPDLLTMTALAADIVAVDDSDRDPEVFIHLKH